MRSLRFLILSFSFAICALLFAPPCYALNLDKLKTNFLRGDYKAAISEGEKIMANCGVSADLEELYYILGLSYLKDGNYLRASDIFEIILKELEDSVFKNEAKLGLADAYFLRGDYDKAAGYYKDLLELGSKNKYRAQVYYRLSQCAFKRGKTQEGKEYLDRLNSEFPLNFEAKMAKDISAPSDFYTVQVGSFSSPANAGNLCEKLLKKGYGAYVQETDSGKEKSFRVRVGRLSSRTEAVKLESKLSAEGYPTKIAP